MCQSAVAIKEWLESGIDPNQKFATLVINLAE
jgi:hypothetical protein